MQDDPFIFRMQQQKTGLFLFMLLVLLNAGQNDAFAQEPQQIEYDADDIMYDKNIASGAYRLINHVVFRHKNTIMYCDSAYFYAAENSLEAFENVHINQGDSVQIYGDYLYYDGNTRLAKIRKNVRLSSSSTRLTSQAVDYDLHNNYRILYQSCGYHQRRKQTEKPCSAIIIHARTCTSSGIVLWLKIPNTRSIPIPLSTIPSPIRPILLGLPVSSATATPFIAREAGTIRRQIFPC